VEGFTPERAFNFFQQKDMSKKERREHPRIHSLNLLAYVCMNENSETVRQGMARTLDVSEGGILMETHVPIDPQYTVSLTLGLEDELTDIQGKVVHFRRDGNGKFQSGIRFMETEAPTSHILKKFIVAFKKQYGDLDQSVSAEPSNTSSVTARLMALISNISEGQQRALLSQLEAYQNGNRREHLRAPCFIPVDYANQDRVFKGFIQDISAGGLFIKPRTSFSVGEEITLTFSPPNCQEPIKIKGEIVRSNQLGIGVKFKTVKKAFRTCSWLDCRGKSKVVRKEKRKDPRVEFHCLAIIEGVYGEKRITDISLGGVFVECESELIPSFHVGQELGLLIKLPAEDDLIKVNAQIVNVTERGIGCKFIELGRKCEDAIQQTFNLAKHTLPIL
jgi:Tfp pilus assembly protein PilZ